MILKTFTQVYDFYFMILFFIKNQFQLFNIIINYINLYLNIIKVQYFFDLKQFNNFFVYFYFMILLSTLTPNKLKIWFVTIYHNNYLIISAYWLHNMIFSNIWFFLISLKTLKVKFFGKGYRIFLSKYRNSITFNFGFSHYYLIYFFNIIPIILAKTKLFFFGINYFIAKFQLNKFLSLRKINIFTMKGIRLFKQIIKKKIGKLSTYF